MTHQAQFIDDRMAALLETDEDLRRMVAGDWMRYRKKSVRTISQLKKDFRAPSAREQLSLEWPRESHQRKARLLGACRAAPDKSVSRGRAFDRASGNRSCVAPASMPSPALTKRSRHPCRLPCGPCRPGLTASQGNEDQRQRQRQRWRATA